jgi:hypothetical protein
MLKKKSAQYILNKSFISHNYTLFDITNTNSTIYGYILQFSNVSQPQEVGIEANQ